MWWQQNISLDTGLSISNHIQWQQRGSGPPKSVDHCMQRSVACIVEFCWHTGQVSQLAIQQMSPKSGNILSQEKCEESFGHSPISGSDVRKCLRKYFVSGKFWSQSGLERRWQDTCVHLPAPESALVAPPSPARHHLQHYCTGSTLSSTLLHWIHGYSSTLSSTLLHGCC